MVGAENALQREDVWKYPFEYKTPIQGSLSDYRTLLISLDMVILPISPVFYRDPQILAMVDRIVFNESKGNPTAQNPLSTAYGLCQFIDGTWKYVQEKWNEELDRDNERDQLYACTRLYEEEGISHWITSTQI